MRPTLINARWEIVLPDHRADFHEVRPWWEAARLADMYAHRDQVTRILDVGSEEGDLTALYASWGWSVDFVDPSQPWTIQTLETFDANNLTPGKFFTGFLSDDDNLERDVHRDPSFASLEEHTHIRRMKLDTFTDLYGVPDAITMDVEGSELRVLQGAAQTLSENSPIVWMSIHETCDFDAVTPSSVHEFMRQFGYGDQFLAYDHEWHVRFWKP